MKGLPPTIGRYEVLRPLGQGGMGRVVLARDSVLGRHVALKLLRGDLGLPPETRDALFVRMRHEARAAAALSHPNMVTLHDMGEEPGLGLYLVFEYIDGPTLRERLEMGALAPSEVATMARALGDALTEAHEAGVIHRDVKPENVLLARTGPKITDFGIARLPDSNLTRAGAILGTPAYSAPEALSSGTFGPLSDQFSLAVTMYESLAGQRAFYGDDTLAVVAHVGNGTPTPLVEVSPLGRAMARVDFVLSRALSKDPAKRYASCRDFGTALGLALDVASGTATLSESPPSRGSVFMARASIVPRATRRVHNVAAAVALLVILGLVLFGRRAPSINLPGIEGEAPEAETPEGVSWRRIAAAFSSATAPSAGVVAPRPGAGARPRPSSARATTPGPAGPAASSAGSATGASGGALGGADAALPGATLDGGVDASSGSDASAAP